MMNASEEFINISEQEFYENPFVFYELPKDGSIDVSLSPSRYNSN